MFTSCPEAPKIDWSKYKNAIRITDLLENFEKQYNAVKIPYPEDKYTASKLLPYSQMTYKDAAYIEPDLTLGLENKPSFWPHQEMNVFDKPQEEGSEKQKKS
ncbi:ATP synthase subunit d, mitochondrial-like [Daktulosphaira vitifoliae]|uniref:ATP synthase subunit d, mitochondrial-like n=1 Tax=Daktulosphaira vitifoliae TaxID=58002 RepID=UPI0021AACF2C|nr:ATP synthase subunit d, mitochondrial-like [Daktulosphaira vitifoliae]